MPATAPTFADSIFPAYLGIPKSTANDYLQRLRAGKLVRRGKQGPGALPLTTSEVGNWLIALCAATATTRERPDATETVKLVRAARRIFERSNPSGLSIDRAHTFGQAIDSLIDDMRAGRKAAKLRIRFVNNGGRIVVNLGDAAFVFRNDDHPADHPYSLTFVHELNGDVLEVVAAAMGPPS